MPALSFMEEIDRISDEFRLKVTISDGDELVTETPPTLTTPAWGLNMSLQGNRDYQHIFRLPNKGGWIQNWVFSRGAEAELLPEAGIENSTAESTTIFRALALTAQAMPMMSSHWFLCPFQSCNGFTVGLAYMDVTVDRLDECSVHPVPCGRFAMDEATGEVFMTAWNEASLMTVGWTASVSSCERIRELFIFEAPKKNGEPPGKPILRNSFYERRDCRICGRPNIPPCRAPAARARAVSRHDSAGKYLFPLQNVYRRFRGCFFGVVVKSVYSPGTRGPQIVAAVPVICDIRHGVASVARRLRINLRQSAFSFGMGPTVGARMLALEPRRGVTARFIEALDSDSGGNASSETSACSTAAGSDAKRIRNQDNVHDRDSIIHLRKVRNRESAARTNEARKRRIAATKAELIELQTNRLPQLKLRLEQVRYENKRLKEMLAAQKHHPDEFINPEGVLPLSINSGILDFNDDIFL